MGKDSETSDAVFLTGSIIAAAVAPWTLLVTGPVAIIGMFAQGAARKKAEAEATDKFRREYDQFFTAALRWEKDEEAAHEWALARLRGRGWDV